MRSGSEVRSRGSVVIHPTAIVHPDAELGEGVSVGPYSIIAGTAKIGDRTLIGAHAVIEGNSVLGKENEVFTGAVIGSRTQDKKYDGGTSYLHIGDRNKIREYVTINPGTKEGTQTTIGDDNLLMAYSHVAHDCVVKNHVVLRMLLLKVILYSEKKMKFLRVRLSAAEHRIKNMMAVRVIYILVIEIRFANM